MNVPDITSLNSSTCTERYIKLHYPEFWRYIISNYPTDLKWAEKMYWYYHSLTDYPKCETCGCPVGFINFNMGYRRFCSRRCQGQSDMVKKRRMMSSIKRFGVANPMQSESIKDKFKQTNIEKHGVKNPFQDEIIKDKIKQINLEKYGIEYPMQSEVIKEKSKASCIAKYGVEYYSQSDAFKDIIKTHQPEIKQKTKQTNLERYGAEYASQSDVVKNKIKQTNLDKYGVENYSQSDAFKNAVKEIQSKQKQTNLERYGSENYSQSTAYKKRLPEINQKSKQTNLKKYGVEYPTQSDDIKQKIYNTKKQNGTFNTSNIEIQFESWLDENNIPYIRQYKSDKYPFNCDFYFPDTNIYLEIQGHWSHGGHPFDPSNKDDIKKLNEWKSKGTKYYDNVIDVWTVRDPMKRKLARENGLNWCEFFTNDIDVLIKIF